MKKTLALLVLGFAALLIPAAARAAIIVGLTSANSLVTFDSASPGTVSAPLAITGLVGGAGERLAGIDFRPSDGALVALTRQDSGANIARGRVYTLDLLTGAATLINGTDGLRDAANNEVLLAEPNSFSYGIDFNPVPNALRIVNTADQNLRITLGGAGVTNVDTALNGPGAGDNPFINAVAYSNNVAGATTTTLYALDAVPDRLRTIGGLNGTPSPNLGQVFDVGPLSPFIPLVANAIGFDISGETGIAYASFGPTTDGPGLFTVNLATGATASLGDIGAPVVDITVVPTAAAVPEPSTLTLMAIGVAGLFAFARRRRKGE